MATFNICEGFAIDDDLAEALEECYEGNPVAWDDSGEECLRLHPTRSQLCEEFGALIVFVHPEDARILVEHYDIAFTPTHALFFVNDYNAQFTHELTIGDSLTELIELAESAYSVRMVTE